MAFPNYRVPKWVAKFMVQSIMALLKSFSLTFSNLDPLHLGLEALQINHRLCRCRLFNFIFYTSFHRAREWHIEEGY